MFIHPGGHLIICKPNFIEFGKNLFFEYLEIVTHPVICLLRLEIYLIDRVKNTHGV